MRQAQNLCIAAQVKLFLDVSRSVKLCSVCLVVSHFVSCVKPSTICKVVSSSLKMSHKRQKEPKEKKGTLGGKSSKM